MAALYVVPERLTLRDRAACYGLAALATLVVALVMGDIRLLLGAPLLIVLAEGRAQFNRRPVAVELTRADLRIPAHVTRPLLSMFSFRGLQQDTIVDLIAITELERDHRRLVVRYYDSESRSLQHVAVTPVEPDRFNAEIAAGIRLAQGVGQALGSPAQVSEQRFDLAAQPVPLKRRVVAYAIAVAAGGAVGWWTSGAAGLAVGLIVGVVPGEILSRLSLGEIPAVKLAADAIELPDGYGASVGGGLRVPYTSIMRVHENGSVIEVERGPNDPLTIRPMDPQGFASELRARLSARR